MGQICRINRAQRFVTEFGNDYVARSHFRPGQKLTVKEVRLTMRESTEEVVECLILEDETGETQEVEIPGVCFDPESWSSDETMDQVAADLDLTEDDARQRIAKADL